MCSGESCNAGALVNAGAGGARWWERRFLRNAKTQNPTLTLATEFARITARLAEFSPVTIQGGRRSLRRRCRALRAPRPLALVRHDDGYSRAAELSESSCSSCGRDIETETRGKMRHHFSQIAIDVNSDMRLHCSGTGRKPAVHRRPPGKVIDPGSRVDVILAERY